MRGVALVYVLVILLVKCSILQLNSQLLPPADETQATDTLGHRTTLEKTPTTLTQTSQQATTASSTNRLQQQDDSSTSEQSPQKLKSPPDKTKSEESGSSSSSIRREPSSDNLERVKRDATNSEKKQKQSSSELIRSNNKLGGNNQLTAAAATTTTGDSPASGHLKFEFQRYDGWYNNLANSDWGTPNSRLRRKVAPAYSDGVYQMSEEGRPSARLLSQRMMRGEDGQASRRNLTTLFAFFGQVISSEILMASESGCPIEMHRIKIEKCDPMYDRECRGGRTMPFYRAAYDPATGQSPNLPREQLNRVTSWLDGSFIYSTSETWLNTMRSFDGKGTLKMVAAPQAAAAAATDLDTMLMGPQQQQQHAQANQRGQVAPARGGGDKLVDNVTANPQQPMPVNAPMSLFGYPVRNKKRAPLINQMPAHHLKMKTAERMFLLGDPRTNQNPVILAFGILFYRWHNVLAERIHAEHPDWSDEEIFQRARRLVIASLQNIILYEYLPTLLDTPAPYAPERLKPQQQRQQASNATSLKSNDDLNLVLLQQQQQQQFDPNDLITPYTGYKPDLHPGISHVFQSAAFRFGHTMIPPGLYLRDAKCRFLDTPQGYKGIRLCSTWWNAEEVVSKVGIERLLMGAASQIAEREDYVLCNDVRDKLFGPLDFSRRDLAALNIMRGRDNGLADYNTVRQAFKLPRIGAWRDINPQLAASQPELFEQLAALYGNQLDGVDLYIGGMLESDTANGRPGPLFRRIIKEQFERLRDSDRFWFENLESGIFSAAEIDEIRRIKLYDIIVNSTLIPDHSIQTNVFKFAPDDPCPQPGQLSSAQLQPCYIVKGHSYFKGSELTYLLVCLTLVLIPILCALLANAVINRQDRKRRQFKAKQEYQRNIQANSAREAAGAAASDKDGASASKDEKFYAKEWLHSELKRKIKVKLGPAPDESIYILDRKCQVQRRISLAEGSTVVVELSSNFAYTLPVPLQSSAASLASAGGSSPSALHTISTTTSTASLVDRGPKALDGSLINAVDLDQPVNHKPMVLIRAARNYDLVLQFCNVQHRRKFIFKLHHYLSSINKPMSLFRVPREMMLANAETKEKRQQRLEQFFREAYALTFSPGDAKPLASHQVSPDVSLVMRTSLSRREFAEALGMRPDSLFVNQMFNCIDKDKNGSISFQEFLDTVDKFSRGKPDDKLRIIFDMCDHTGKGEIEKRELVKMLRSLVDIAKTKSLKEDKVLEMIHEMFRAVGLENKPMLSYDDFKLIISSHNEAAFSNSQQEQQQVAGRESPSNSSCNSSAASSSSQNDGSGNKFATFRNNMSQQILAIGLDMKGAKKNFFIDTSGSLLNPPGRKMTVVDSTGNQRALIKAAAVGASTDAEPSGFFGKLADKWRALITDLEEHRQDIVYLLMFFTIVIVLFFERFIMYSFLSEHMDLRHVMGFGIAITRGSAASLSFCYAMLLLSMCRNIMTWIRTMGVREYIPLDSHVSFHKIVAMTALAMTMLHTVGHCVNFYHVTQQPVEHLRCLTKEMQFSGESRPTFFYWIFQTVTGSTGLALWILCSIIYAFAHQRVRQRAYSFFWSTHKLYYLIYALSLLHGSSKLTGSPRFWLFFIIPAILFTIDKIISLQTKLLQLEIFETECLPSDVISVKFARPPSFKFLSGQWVRLACTAFRPHEFHAFTLTSAPQDDYLSVHVRAQGPWTWKLRSLFDPANLQYNKLLNSQLPPRIRIEGPFGGGNQDWYKYEVAVMIGGGIGVTPYASILNDLVFGTSTNRYSAVAYKKVYFIWICPSHRNFEWFIDVLRDVENKDVTNVLEMHIFITQFFHKFDLRTTMLYICENHFQRISNRSLFTGLKAINHFGRPDIAALLQHVQNQHSCVNKVGVFSCGPKALTKSVTEACEKVNKRRKLPFFLHQYENFS